MEIVKITKTIEEEKYKASDGEIFNSEWECKKYEEDLDFLNFPLDENILTKPISLDNYKHFIYYLINNIYENPLNHKHDLNQKYENLEEIKNYFIYSVEHLQNEENLLNDFVSHNRQRSTFSIDIIKSQYKNTYKKDYVFNAYKILFDIVKIGFDDFKTPVYDREYKDSTKRGLEYSKEDKERFYSNKILVDVYKQDCIKTFDFLVSNKKFNVESFFNIFHNNDFIIEYSGYSHIIHLKKNGFDVIKWITYIINTDIDYKFYKTINNNNKIYLTVEEAIEHIENKEIKDILHKAGSNIVNINKKHKKSELFEFSNMMLNKLEILINNTDYLKNKYSFYKNSLSLGTNNRSVYFYPKEIGDNKKEENVVEIRIHNFNNPTNNSTTTFSLKEHLKTPDLLIEKIMYCLESDYLLKNTELKEVMKIEKEIANASANLEELKKELEKKKNKALYGR